MLIYYLLILELFKTLLKVLCCGIELPSPKGVGFVIHRSVLNDLLESYSFSKRLTFRSPYGRLVTTNYWLSNLSSTIYQWFFQAFKHKERKRFEISRKKKVISSKRFERLN